ncbi:MAG: hypothetical protein QXO51_04720 [Halobacteria archaeon]
MVNILHIVASGDTGLAFATALRQKTEHNVSFLLLHEGVRATPPAGFPVFAARDDCEARNVRPGGAKLLAWGEIVDLLVASERVLKW